MTTPQRARARLSLAAAVLGGALALFGLTFGSNLTAILGGIAAVLGAIAFHRGADQ